MCEEFRVGGILWEESYVGGILWEESHVGGILWEESRVGGILLGRNPVWEESHGGGIQCERNPGGRNPMGGIPWEEFCMGGIPMEPELSINVLTCLEEQLTSRSRDTVCSRSLLRRLRGINRVRSSSMSWTCFGMRHCTVGSKTRK